MISRLLMFAARFLGRSSRRQGQQGVRRVDCRRRVSGRSGGLRFLSVAGDDDSEMVVGARFPFLLGRRLLRLSLRLVATLWPNDDLPFRFSAIWSLTTPGHEAEGRRRLAIRASLTSLHI